MGTSRRSSNTPVAPGLTDSPIVPFTATKCPPQNSLRIPTLTLQPWVHSGDAPKENDGKWRQTQSGSDLFALSSNLARFPPGSRPFLSLALAPAAWESPSVV